MYKIFGTKVGLFSRLVDMTTVGPEPRRRRAWLGQSLADALLRSYGTSEEPP